MKADDPDGGRRPQTPAQSRPKLLTATRRDDASMQINGGGAGNLTSDLRKPDGLNWKRSTQICGTNGRRFQDHYKILLFGRSETVKMSTLSVIRRARFGFSEPFLQKLC